MWHWSVLYCTHQYRNDNSKTNTVSKYWWHAHKCLLQNCQQMQNFKNLQDLNSRTFQVLSSTLSVSKHFQGPWSFYSKFKHFQGFRKHAMNPVNCYIRLLYSTLKGNGSAYSITKRRILELIPVLGSQPPGDVSYKPGGRLPLLSARPTVTLTTFKRAATNFAAWWTEAWC